MTARRTLDKHMTEAQLQDAIVTCAKAFGWLVFHPYDSRRSVPGWPDLVMLRDGRMIVAELKSEFGRTSRAQDAWLEAFKLLAWAVEDIGKAHVIGVYQWRPLDWSSGAIERILRDGAAETEGRDE